MAWDAVRGQVVLLVGLHAPNVVIESPFPLIKRIKDKAKGIEGKEVEVGVGVGVGVTNEPNVNILVILRAPYHRNDYRS